MDHVSLLFITKSEQRAWERGAIVCFLKISGPQSEVLAYRSEGKPSAKPPKDGTGQDIFQDDCAVFHD
jgi:hypothetical protein